MKNDNPLHFYVDQRVYPCVKQDTHDVLREAWRQKISISCWIQVKNSEREIISYIFVFGYIKLLIDSSNLQFCAISSISTT
jgi:hypothetical protein